MPEITNRLNYIFLGFMILEYWSGGVMDIFDCQLPNSDRLRSCSGLALLPARARRSVWTI